jgi:hypothetical protein
LDYELVENTGVELTATVVLVLTVPSGKHAIAAAGLLS